MYFMVMFAFSSVCRLRRARIGGFVLVFFFLFFVAESSFQE